MTLWEPGKQGVKAQLLLLVLQDLEWGSRKTPYNSNPELTERVKREKRTDGQYTTGSNVKRSSTWETRLLFPNRDKITTFFYVSTPTPSIPLNIISVTSKSGYTTPSMPPLRALEFYSGIGRGFVVINVRLINWSLYRWLASVFVQKFGRCRRCPGF
jgi:hypothetical protein